MALHGIDTRGHLRQSAGAALCVALVGLAVCGVLRAHNDSNALDVPHGSLATLPWTPLPQVGFAQSVIYRSPDGRRVAAAFKESGSMTYTYPFDEFVVVLTGTSKISVHGGPSFALKEGDFVYFREGMVVDFDESKDYSQVVMLIGNHRVTW